MSTTIANTPGTGHAPSLVHLLRGWAEREPEKTAYTFLGDAEGDEARATYADMDRRARAVAALLQKHLQPGERALLIYPPGLDYVAAFLGCLYAGVVAVPAYPPEPARLARTLPRLLAIARDARAEVVLTTSAILALSGQLRAFAPDLAGLRWLAGDGALPDPDTWRSPSIGPETLALLQYTSGSTSTPRAVMLLHRNVVHNLHQAHLRARIEPHNLNVGWLPPYHDMGLVGLVLCPLATRGCPVVLMSPLSFLRRPRRWLEALSRFRGTHTVAPDFAFDLCVRTTTPAQRAALDLGAVELAMSGSEPVRRATLDRFCAAFAPSGFRRHAFFPCYGLAETTVMASAPAQRAPPVVRFFRDADLRAGLAIEAAPDDPGARALVGCGSAVADSRLAIVDAGTGHELPPGTLGEIWVSGPGVSPGYWANPEATAAAFGARLAGGGEAPFLRTGDLGFIAEGELFIAARIKDLLKLRGRAYFPSEIEATVEACHPALRAGGAAALAIDDGDAARLVLVVELTREVSADPASLDGPAVLLAIQAAMAVDHQIGFDAVTLVRAGSVPKTSSGKLQRYLCRDAFLDGTLDALYRHPAAG